MPPISVRRTPIIVRTVFMFVPKNRSETARTAGHIASEKLRNVFGCQRLLDSADDCVGDIDHTVRQNESYLGV